jgi:hypothetical protein
MTDACSNASAGDRQLRNRHFTLLQHRGFVIGATSDCIRARRCLTGLSCPKGHLLQLPRIRLTALVLANKRTEPAGRRECTRLSVHLACMLQLKRKMALPKSDTAFTQSKASNSGIAKSRTVCHDIT